MQTESATPDEAFSATKPIVAAKGTLRDYLDALKTRNFLGIVLLGLCFFLIFTAYNTAQNYATTILGTELGNIALGCLYGTFTLGTCVAPKIVRSIKPKFALILGGFGYAIFIASQYVYLEFPDSQGALYYVVIVAALINGLGAAMIWVAEGNFAAEYSPEDFRGLYFGFFYGIFSCSYVVGNVISYFYFQAGQVDAGLYKWFLVILGAGLLLFLALPRPVRTGSGALTPVNDSLSLFQEIYELLRLLAGRRFLLLVPLIAFTGTALVYGQANIPRYFEKSTNGAAFAINGAVQIISSFGFGMLKDNLRASYYVTMALVMGFVVYSSAIGLEVGYPSNAYSISDGGIAFPLLVLCFSTATFTAITVFMYALLGRLYPEGVVAARAVACYMGIQSLGATLVFALNASLSSLQSGFVCGILAVCICLSLLVASVGIYRVLPSESEDSKTQSKVDLGSDSGISSVVCEARNV